MLGDRTFRLRCKNTSSVCDEKLCFRVKEQTQKLFK